MHHVKDMIDGLRIAPRDLTEQSRPRRWIYVVASVIALSVVGTAAYWQFVSAKDPLANIEPTTATTAVTPPVAPNPVPQDTDHMRAGTVLDASGYIVARRLATVSAKITGRLEQVLIDEGMAVEEGQVLATLDATDATANLALQQSYLGAAKSRRDEASVQLALAELHEERIAQLLPQQVVSLSQYDETVARRDSLRAHLSTAQWDVRVAEEQVRIAEIGLADTVVKAPFAGVVIAKSAQPGEIVSPLSAGGGFTRTGIGTIVDMKSLEIVVDVGESYIGRIMSGMPVSATLHAYPDLQLPGEVIAIVPAADRGRATIMVRIALRSDDTRVVPDMGVSVRFLQPPHH